MANKERGEYTIKAGDEAYTLRLTTNASCELEDFTGRTLNTIINGCMQGSFKDLRLLLWAALQEHHSASFPANASGLKAVGAWVDRFGGMEVVEKQLEAFMGINADPGEDETEKKAVGGGPQDSRPLDAQAGTGEASTLMPLSSV